MFGQRKKVRNARIDSLIGRNSEIKGDISFVGGLHVDGRIRGNVEAEADTESVLTLSEHGTIEGEVNVPNIVINGTVIGDVHSSEHIELASNARITGNVYYNFIEMAMGAEVNGNLVRETPEMEAPIALSHDNVVAAAK